VLDDDRVVTTTSNGGVTVYDDGRIQSTYACEFCGAPFVPVVHGQRTCGAAPCQNRRRYLDKLHDPRQQKARRERSRTWARANRNCRKRKPVLLGPPIHVPGPMPGVGFALHVDPAPRWAIQHRNVRALHGMMTAILGKPHQRWPEWALLPSRSGVGWSVYVRDEDAGTQLYEQREVQARLYDRRVTVRFGAKWRPKYPVMRRRRGWRALRIDAITPIVIRSTGSTVHRLIPSKTALISTLTTEFPARVGVELDRPDDLVLELVATDARTERVLMGGKLATWAGWLGSVIVRTNAIGEFLLRCAANGPGLGGRTAFGFGRIVVSNAT
jgi:hypothetical protein